MRYHILSTCLYLYYHDCALCLDLGFKLLLQFYHERSLHRKEGYQLNIEYAMGVCYCRLLRVLCCKMRIKKLRLFFKVLYKFIFRKKVELEVFFCCLKHALVEHYHLIRVLLSLQFGVLILIWRMLFSRIK